MISVTSSSFPPGEVEGNGGVVLERPRWRQGGGLGDPWRVTFETCRGGFYGNIHCMYIYNIYI